MCGIVGKIDLSGPVDHQLLVRMCQAVEHRGPDSRGMHESNGVGLGIQRLAVIDLSTGDQPIYNEDRSVAGGALRSMPEDVLLDPAATDRGVFEPDRVRSLIDEHRAGTRAPAGS